MWCRVKRLLNLLYLLGAGLWHLLVGCVDWWWLMKAWQAWTRLLRKIVAQGRASPRRWRLRTCEVMRSGSLLRMVAAAKICWKLRGARRMGPLVALARFTCLVILCRAIWITAGSTVAGLELQLCRNRRGSGGLAAVLQPLQCVISGMVLLQRPCSSSTTLVRMWVRLGAIRSNCLLPAPDGMTRSSGMSLLAADSWRDISVRRASLRSLLRCMLSRCRALMIVYS